MLPTVNLFWFRRDLRLDDNAGLHLALKSHCPVVPLFIFDKDILDLLEDEKDRRVGFIYQSLEEMQRELLSMGSTLEVIHGRPESVFRELIRRYDIRQVFANADYEPYANQRDGEVQSLLGAAEIPFRDIKDHVVFEKKEIMKADGSPYTIFTPYSKKWKEMLRDDDLKELDTRKHFGQFYKQEAKAIPSLASMGFQQQPGAFPPKVLPYKILGAYSQQRDFPGIPGTSRLSVHLRFGTLGIRSLARLAWKQQETFLNELIWRDFYHMILWNFPAVGNGKCFKPAHELIPWRNNEAEFDRWCKGMTGYPLVDAGMRELNATGFMHNRVRMITASFLAKHLLIDWRWGEAYFATALLDFDLAANNGGWQWAAGCGCDAAPYFRVFNPSLQAQKFDPGLLYIRRWVPELETLDYPAPMVEHGWARARALQAYGNALK